jgi:hypothetical protein
VLVVAIAALARPGGEAVGQDLAVGAPVVLDALELERLPALAQLARGRRLALVAACELVEECGGAAVPVDQRAVAVEGGDLDCDRWTLLQSKWCRC